MLKIGIEDKYTHFFKMSLKLKKISPLLLSVIPLTPQSPIPFFCLKGFRLRTYAILMQSMQIPNVSQLCSIVEVQLPIHFRTNAVHRLL
ncbi:hypothetical protein DCC39_15380 [Pueribacillus theae]|uniref:Uncharacterized protein n=1 Tax=Pueribacillus theae TaxID=2171751 RepID=A0A2U1JT37_9BACI|nr:hypothetical protein DCC39_15380 [Pueribacillus theae]